MPSAAPATTWVLMTTYVSDGLASDIDPSPPDGPLSGRAIPKSSVAELGIEAELAASRLLKAAGCSSNSGGWPGCAAGQMTLSLRPLCADRWGEVRPNAHRAQAFDSLRILPARRGRGRRHHGSFRISRSSTRPDPRAGPL